MRPALQPEPTREFLTDVRSRAGDPAGRLGHTGVVASRVVDSATIPRAVAGHPALELCNTKAGWGAAESKEYLLDYRCLVIWARELGLVTAPLARRLLRDALADPRKAARVLNRTRRLRDGWYSVLTTPAADSAALADVSRELSRASAAARLHQGSNGPRLVQPAEDLDLPLRLLADEVRHFIDDGLAADVGVCPGTGCGWLFLREGRSRRWCIMAVCGNREKARRYAQRRRRPGGRASGG